MYQTRPDDYTAFRCLAGACPQTCCAAWEIVVDPDAQDAYLRLQHPLAAKLRRVLRVDSEGDTYFAQTDGRCPFLCADGLCELQRTLGEQSLCRTCRDFPRWEVLLCDRVEQGLSPACPEAARRLLGQAPIDFPRETAIGALGLYVSDTTVANFQPMNVNFGIMPPLGCRIKGKRNKNAELSRRSLEIIDGLRESVLDGVKEENHEDHH